LSDKKRIAFVNVPDLDQVELNDFIERLNEDFKKMNIPSLPYTLVFTSGREWKTMSKEELLEILEKIYNLLREDKN